MTESGVLDAPDDLAARPCGAPARPRDARRGTGALRDLLERRRPAERSTGLARRCCSRRRSSRRTAPRPTSRSSSVNRLDPRSGSTSCSRPRASPASASSSPATGLTARPGAPAPNGRVEFAGRVDEARLAEPTAAASRSTTRRSTRTTGSSLRGVHGGEARDHDTDAGGPLDVVADRRTGLVVERPTPSRRPVRTCSGTRTRRRGGGPRGRRAAVLARDGRDAGGGRVEDGVLLPDGAVALGDRGLPALPPGAGRERTGSRSARARASSRAAPTSRSTTSATTRRRTAGSSRRCAHPGVAVLHEWVLHHLIAGLTLGAEGRRAVPGGARARPRDRRPAARPRRRRRLRAAAVGDAARGLPARRRRARRDARPRRDRALALRRGARARSGGTAGRCGGSCTRPGPSRRSIPSTSDGPVIGCLGHLNASKHPAAARGVRARARRCAETRLLLVGAAAPQLDLPGRIARLGLPPEAIVREEYVDERRFWSLMAAADVVVRCGRRRWADVRQRDPRPLARAAARRLGRGLVR